MLQLLWSARLCAFDHLRKGLVKIISHLGMSQPPDVTWLQDALLDLDPSRPPVLIGEQQLSCLDQQFSRGLLVLTPLAGDHKARKATDLIAQTIAIHP